MTGKGLSFGGSLIRPEATGYGATYFLVEVLKHLKQDIKGKTFALSGFGNVSWGAVSKITELGGKVLTISGPDGYIYDKDGITGKKIDYMLEMRASGRDKVQDYADKFGVEFFAGQKPWGNVKADIYMPCATQNEIKLEDAEKIVAMGVKIVNEVSNMPTTNEALAYLQKNNVLVCPSKAVNAGGVAVSGLEMSQNSERLSWSAEEVDRQLKTIMANISQANHRRSFRIQDGLQSCRRRKPRRLQEGCGRYACSGHLLKIFSDNFKPPLCGGFVFLAKVRGIC